MKLTQVYEQIIHFDIAGLVRLGLPHEATHGFFDKKIKFSSNSLNLIEGLSQCYSHFARDSITANIEFKFIENGPLSCRLIFNTPIFTYFIYNTSNGMLSVNRNSTTRQTEIAYLGKSPKYKPPLEQIRVIDNGTDDDELFFVAEFLTTVALAGLIKNHLFFHAASLAWQGKGIILAGETMSGKTTLSLELVRAGFDFLSDEVACLDAVSHKLLPFPKGMCLRENDGAKKQRRLVSAKELGIRPGKGACPPQYFFLLSGFKKKPQIRPAPLRDALWYALSSTYTKIADPADMLMTLSPMFNQLKCYHLWPGGIAETVDLIKETLTRETTC